MSRVVHFEIHATDPETLITFYQEILGWSFRKWNFSDYWLIETGPAEQPGINGGLLKRPCEAPGDSPALNAYVCTAQIDALDATVEKALAKGAVLALPKMAVPGIGWLAYIKDPDGNIIGLMQQDPSAK